MIAREPLPRDPRTYGHLFMMGTINIAIPFALITFAEQTVDSSLASVVDQIRKPIYGVLLVIIMLTRPQGIFGTHEAWELFKPKKKAAPAS